MTTTLEIKKPLDPARWLDEHGDYLFRYAIFRLRDAAAAEDAVQETLLAAMQARERFNGRSSERTWLVGILKHKIIDHYRKVGRAHEISFEVDGSRDQFDPFEKSGEWAGHWRSEFAPTNWQVDAAAALDRIEFWETLNRCLAALPAKTATAFVMREIDGFSSEEICNVLALSRDNLWVMLHRARLKLRDSLDAEFFRGHGSGSRKTDRVAERQPNLMAGKRQRLGYFDAAA